MAEYEQVVAFMTNARAETHRIHRTHLADDFRQILQIRRGLKRELFRGRRDGGVVAVAVGRSFFKYYYLFSLYSASTTLPRGPAPLGRGSPVGAPTFGAGSGPSQRVSA